MKKNWEKFWIKFWDKFEIYFWQLLEIGIGVLIVYYSDSSWVYAPPLCSLLVIVGKELNKSKKQKHNINNNYFKG